MRRISFSSGAAIALFFSVLACTSAPRPASAPLGAPARKVSKKPSALEAARASMYRGNWSAAERLLHSLRSGADKQPAVELLSESYFLTGRYPELAALETKGAVRLFQARALRAQGQLDEAKHLLTAVGDGGAPHSAAANSARVLLLGDILLEEGKKSEAAAVLLPLISAANEGKLDDLAEVERARALGAVGRAAHLLRSPEDANDAFNESETLAPADLDLLLARGELFLEKFDFGHAEEILDEAMKLAPAHPEVLLLSARLRLLAALAFAEVHDLAQKVLRINPKNTEARFLLAGVSLRDLSLTEADEHLARGFSINPRDLKLLSMKAAVRFLAEDQVGFDRAVDHVLQLSPGYSEIFRVVGEYAEWEHRYPDIEKLMRRAVRLDRQDARARALLGLTLVRAGSDAAGVVELQRAFELDPYNVRVLNTLNLYEKTIPSNYVEQSEGPFLFRFPVAEAPLLARYVPALVNEAYATMVSRYGFTPTAPIGIEIYESQEQFAVRTSGLPQTGIAGVCFGRKLATVSPVGAPGNLGMTLWHELAHVFHIGLSQNRVPRWLTEGLAEWETAVRDVGWSREMDLELHRALSAKSLPGLGSMSRAFSQARRMSDVGNAYYASGQIAAWIVETKGEATARDLLVEFGNKKLPPEVVPVVLGATFDQLDEQFRAYADTKLSRFDSQFVTEEPLLVLEEIEAGLRRSPQDRTLRFHRALAHLGAGEMKEAGALQTALLREKFDPQVAFSETRRLLAQEKKEEARALLIDMIQRGHDGFEVQMILGRLSFATADPSSAKPHLLRAAEFYPLAAEPLSMLAALHHQSGERDQEIAAVKKWANLSEHDPMVHRRLVRLLLEAKDYPAARRAGELSIWADLAGFETHRLYGLALARAGDLKGAEFEFESALLCPASPTDITGLAETWSDELTRLGRLAEAKRVPARIAKSPMFAPKTAPKADP